MLAHSINQSHQVDRICGSAGLKFTAVQCAVNCGSRNAKDSFLHANSDDLLENAVSNMALVIVQPTFPA